MNARMIQQQLLDLGFTFEKRAQENSDIAQWLCLDEDSIPLASGRQLSQVIWEMDRQLGGVA